MRRTALPHPGAQRDLRGPDGLDDVDDSILVQHSQIGGLADRDAEHVACGLAEFDQIVLPAGDVRQPRDREPEPVLAALGDLFDVAAGFQHRDQPRHGRLVHPSSAAISVTPA
ncbi:hypothetical protein MPRF_37640 [Mycolicibacterium parafortuitum]|uniref:Uncharacterized protein n=1 Tax=Mycolicibacterium parafortuitum TaxID=39692 RepID=A0A7I7U717_MYCPF|nr:hypothetical protein MPRF_37640 [Mycolicibacterium parafortuitum]